MVTTEMIKNGGMESSPGSVVMSIKEIMKLTLETGLDRCIGETEHITKDNGSMEFKMDKEKSIFQPKVLKKGYSKIIKLSKSGKKN
jgi:hypothetical protein